MTADEYKRQVLARLDQEIARGGQYNSGIVGWYARIMQGHLIGEQQAHISGLRSARYCVEMSPTIFGPRSEP